MAYVQCVATYGPLAIRCRKWALRGSDRCATHGGKSPSARVQTPPATNDSPPSKVESSLADPLLVILADALDDLERTRIANENRLRQLTRDIADADGVERGFGLGDDVPQVAQLRAIVDALAGLEHQATLNLQRQMRAHPLGWIGAPPSKGGRPGVGYKQLARLLSAIGDPYWNTLHGRPRTVSELWAYCGLHVLPAGHRSTGIHSTDAGGDASLNVSSDPGHRESDAHGGGAGIAARRRKGQRANWSTTAKMRAYLIAVSCIQQRASVYRTVYELRRAHTAATHPDWTPGHSHNDALRIVSKAVLRDLWREARVLHLPDEQAVS